MKLSRSRLAQVLAQRYTRPGADVDRLNKEVAAYLLSEKRAGELDSLLRDIEQYRADHDGIVEAKAISAFPLTDAVRQEITAKLQTVFPEANQIIISEQVDERVVGGVRLELANQQLDLTVRGKLNLFKALTTSTK